MAVFTTVTQKRGGNPIQTGIGVQIDTVNLDEKQFDAGAAPYDQFDILVRFGMGLTFLRNDQLLDESNGTDLYTIANKPEYFPDGHWELECMLPVGS